MVDMIVDAMNRLGVSFAVGAIAGLGLGYEQVRAIRPDIVWCGMLLHSVRAFGA